MKRISRRVSPEAFVQALLSGAGPVSSRSDTIDTEVGAIGFPDAASIHRTLRRERAEKRLDEIVI